MRLDSTDVTQEVALPTLNHRARRLRSAGAGRRTRDQEAIEVRAFAPEQLPWDELAFWSTEQALRDVLA